MQQLHQYLNQNLAYLFPSVNVGNIQHFIDILFHYAQFTHIGHCIH